METVNHPKHYNLIPATCSKCGHPIECIDVVRHSDFSIGNAIKYLWRAKYKGNELEDLRKAAWYIEDRIKQLEGKKDEVRANPTTIYILDTSVPRT